MSSYFGEIKTVGDLAAALKTFPDEMPVVIQHRDEFFSRLDVSTVKAVAAIDGRGEYLLDPRGDHVVWIY